MIVTPVEYKVLIKPDIVDDKSAGGIFLPDCTRDREEYAVDRGVIVHYDSEGFWALLPGRKPKIGERAIFNRYAGSLITIENNGNREKHRLCNDKDICAIIEE